MGGRAKRRSARADWRAVVLAAGWLCGTKKGFFSVSMGRDAENWSVRSSGHWVARSRAPKIIFPGIARAHVADATRSLQRTDILYRRKIENDKTFWF